MYLGYLYPDSFDVFSLQLITIFFTEDLECLTYNIIKDRPVYPLTDVTKSVGNFYHLCVGVFYDLLIEEVLSSSRSSK